MGSYSIVFEISGILLFFFFFYRCGHIYNITNKCVFLNNALIYILFLVFLSRFFDYLNSTLICTNILLISPIRGLQIAEIKKICADVLCCLCCTKCKTPHGHSIKSTSHDEQIIQIITSAIYILNRSRC